MSGTDARAGVVRQSSLTSVAATVAVASGLLLDLVVAGFFGVGPETDAFVAAARIPLALLATVMAVANQALVPTFSLWLSRHQDTRRTSGLVSTVLLAAMLAAAVLAGLLALLASPVMSVVTPCFDGERQALAAELSRVFVLVLPLTAGSEVLRAYLNARYAFVVPAAMTVVLNLVAVSIVVASGGQDISVVPWAYVAGGLAQFGVLCVVAWRKGLRPRLTDPRAPELRDTARLLPRPLVASSLNPLVRVAELLVASLLPVGSATILHYGNRLVHAIGGTVLFRSVVVALVPRLARAEGDGRREDADRLLLLGTRIMLAISLPLTALFAALALPGTRLVFERGQFAADDATLLGLTLAVYAGSFVGSAVQRALLASFYARLDTRTPLRNTVYGVGANIVLLPLLVYPVRGTDGAVLAVAAAYVLSQYVHVAHAWHRLRSERGLPVRELRAGTRVSVLTAAVAGAVTAGCALALGLYDDDVATARLVLGLLLSGMLGVLVVALGESLGGGGPLRQLRSLRSGTARGPGPDATRREAPTQGEHTA